jgi:DNA-directed RNA polymerase subunit RPC12/RpoP
MTILVEYRCTTCGARTEHFVATPAPSTLECRLCGEDSRRSFATAGLMSTPGTGPAPKREATIDVSCRNNPDVPGLCHLSPEGRERLVARARRDTRAEERIIEKQERHAAEGRPAPSLVSHDHGHGTHGHSDHSHAAAASPVAG